MSEQAQPPQVADWMAFDDHPIAAGRVLVIEGHPGLLEAIAGSLEPRGHRIITAGDGVHGLLEFMREPPAVVILDLQLTTGMDGLTLLAEIKKRSPSVPIVLLADPGARIASVIPGVTVLPKPFLPGKLAEVVQHTIDANDLRAG